MVCLGQEGVGRAAAARDFAVRELLMEKIVTGYENLFTELGWHR